MRAALPAAREIAAGDWVIRVSGGPTKRVNSANACAPDASVAPVLEVAERCYRAADLPTRFRLTPLADEAADADLAQRGYQVRDPSWTMVMSPASGMSDPAVRFGPADRAWQHDHAAASGWDAVAMTAHGVLLARLPASATAATVVEDGCPIAFAVASVAHGRVHLFDVVTVAAARGRGAGQRIVGALLAWGAEQGASAAVLQVLDANVPARALYRRLGFVDAYPYHYRVSG